MNTRFSSSLVSRHRSSSNNKNSKTGLPAFHLERQVNIPLLRSVHGPTWQTQPKTNRCLRKSQRKSQCKSLCKNHCKSQRRSQRKSQRKNPGWAMMPPSRGSLERVGVHFEHVLREHVF